ncbi:hypothetical protein LFLT20_07640 [Limosilactobacillus fermentum]|uniref:isocitrate/isopropylmalate family dehydrogenase n=1 Tax=Limosilactobacillus fermentum TaxID=1613 RepID=UPI001A1F8E8F|nr:hypothetical protein LFLT20_07640 [Limosilactobacillus fermentum]
MQENKTAQIAVLAGDYIGPEMMAAGLKVLQAVSKEGRFEYKIHEEPFGGRQSIKRVIRYHNKRLKRANKAMVPCQ